MPQKAARLTCPLEAHSIYDLLLPRSAANPTSISRLIASEREGLGPGWRSIQAVRAASISG